MKTETITAKVVNLAERQAIRSAEQAERARQGAEAAKQKQRQAKARIREVSPDTADWMNDLVEVMTVRDESGKAIPESRPSAISMKDRDGNLIYRAGRFDPPRRTAR